MQPGNIRDIIADALYSSIPLYPDQKALLDRFIGGDDTVEVAEFDLDSLAMMELCIAIEKEAGYSIIPDELRQTRTLGHLVHAITSR
jgi:acyl carrier protein